MASIRICGNKSTIKKLTVLCLLISITFGCTFGFFVVTPNDTLVIQGDDTQLNCTYAVPDKPAWFKGDSATREAITDDRDTLYGNTHYQVVGDEDNDEYHLRISRVTMEHQDLYECTDLYQGSELAPAQLYVIHSKPQCSVFPNNVLKVGENATFNCTINLDANAPGELVWFKNGTEIHREEGHSSIVNINMKISDKGAAIDCQIQHFTLPSWKWSTVSCQEKIIMDVQYLSDFNMTVAPNTNITEGDTVLFQCLARGGNPGTHNMTLTLNGQIIAEDQKEIRLIYNVTGSDSGVYQCEAFTTFYDGSVHHWIEEEDIIVYYSPKMTPAEQRVFEAPIEDIIDMSCTADGVLTPTIAWFDNDDDVILGDDIFINITTFVENITIVTSTLTVVVADESYYGMYTCAASNNIPPGVGQSFEIVRPGSNTLLIAVTISLAVVTIAVCAFLGFLYFYKKKYQKTVEPIITDTATESPGTNKAVENDYPLFDEGQGDGVSNARETEETNLSIASILDTEADRSAPLEEDGAISLVSLGEHNVGSSEGHIQYADLDLEQRPQNLTPVERTEYATLQVPPANT